MALILRILEPLFLVLAIAWTLILIYLEKNRQQADLLVDVLGLTFLIVVAFLPYSLVALVLRRMRRANLRVANTVRGTNFSKALFWSAGAFILGTVVVLAFILYQLPKREDSREAVKEEFWTYEYKPLQMRITLSMEWEEIPTGSLELPPDIAGGRFAFRKKDTSCILAYATAPEEALGNYVDITADLAANGNIGNPEVLNNVYNAHLEDNYNIKAYVHRERLNFLNERVRTDPDPILSFNEAGIIFVSAHFPEFMENSRQTPVFLFFEDDTGTWDEYCLSDMVRIVRSVDRIDGVE